MSMAGNIFSFAEILGYAFCCNALMRVLLSFIPGHSVERTGFWSVRFLAHSLKMTGKNQWDKGARTCKGKTHGPAGLHERTS